MSAVLPNPSVMTPVPVRGLLTGKAWSGVLAAIVIVAVLVPILNLMVPAGSAFHLSDYAVQLVAKIMCYAICALAMDLIWGYTGILSLGHGVFFALGGYAMGMYLMRQIGTDGQYKMEMPDFMVFLNWKEYPWHWALSDSFVAQMLLVVLAPGLLAFVFGYFAFRSRIKGVYFSIITQAMTYAAMLLFFRNETGFGGNNGFTDFKRILSIPIATPSMRMVLFVITGLTLVGFFVFARWLVMSNLTLPYNRIAIIVFAGLVLAGVALLIAHTRLGLFVRGVTQNRKMAACMGVNTARIDTYAFALGSGIAGLAGCALSQVGNVGPDLGQSYIVDSFMVVVLGGVGQLAGTVYAALGLGVLNKLLEGWQGAVLAKIMVLVFIVVFIQKRPQGIFAMKGRSAEA